MRGVLTTSHYAEVARIKARAAPLTHVNGTRVTLLTHVTRVLVCAPNM